MAEANTSVGDVQPALRRVMGPKLLLLFIIGDILGTGIYALVGQVAEEVGGAAWLAFLVAFAVAMITAFSYLELVTKYPQAAGAALYLHKAFGIHFLTFMATFVVMSSGITSASTASRAFAANLNEGFGLDLGNGGIVLIALGFMALVAAVNFRGVGESVKINVVLTLVELSGLLLVILVGVFAIAGGNADWSRVVAFDAPEDKGVFLAVTSATSLAFFAMVGFEDSVNMAEECHEPRRIFPKIMITGLTITGIIYVLVAICSVALVPVGPLAASETPLVEVVRAGAPGIPADAVLPFISMFARRELGADQHVDGVAAALRHGEPGRAAQAAGTGASVAPHPVGGDHLHDADLVRTDHLCLVGAPGPNVVAALGGTTALLLLAVFSLGQRRRARAAEGQGGRRALPGPTRACPSSARSLAIPGAAVLRTGHDPVRGRRDAVAAWADPLRSDGLAESSPRGEARRRWTRPSSTAEARRSRTVCSRRTSALGVLVCWNCPAGPVKVRGRSTKVGTSGLPFDPSGHPVGFQNSATGADLRFQAARSYSLISPPRTGRRLIRWRSRSGAGWSGRGGRSCSARCGRRPL